MAKNNKGASFIDKMKNAPTVEEKQREAEASTREADSLTSAEIAKLNVSPDLVKALNKKRTERVGRPPKGKVSRNSLEVGCKSGETRATFILKKDVVKKLKYIALIDTRTIKDIMEEIVGGYVSEWEKKNGEIHFKKGE
jgi:hypothetical protein